MPNYSVIRKLQGFPSSSAGKESSCNAGDPSLIPESEKSPGEGIGYPLQYSWASLVAQTVKNLPLMQETWIGKIPWRRAWQPTPVFLPGESPWTGEPGRLQSMELQRVRHDWLSTHTGLLWVDLIWDSLYFLGLDIFFLSKVREVFGYYVFKCILCLFLFLLWFV